MTTEDIIKPIVAQSYGNGSMAKALAQYLADMVDTKAEPYSQSREYHIMLTCWDWFPGGGAAATTGERIERALVEAGR